MLKLGEAKRYLLSFPPWFSISTYSFQSSYISFSSNSLNPHSFASHQSSSLDCKHPCTRHVSIIKNGFESDSSVMTDLLFAYFTNGQIPISRSLFPIIFEANIHLLNSRLKELSNSRLFEQILHLYFLLRISDTNPDNFTFPYVLKACASLNAYIEGQSIHSQILKSGYGDNAFVANSLIDMYSKSKSLQSAREIFDEMPKHNLVSWNCIISGYALNGLPDTALEFCSSMKFEGMRLDKVGLKIVLPACGQLGVLCLGKSVHAQVIVSGLSSDTILATAVMDMYAKCGRLDVARRLFNEIPLKDVVAWNAMTSGYSQRGKPEMVLKFFYKMQVESVEPSVVTVLIALQACTDLASLLTGEIIHCYITRLGLSSDASIEALLINMYSKCGKLNLAYQVFSEVREENVTLWSVMIHGLGMHGYGEAALMGFFKMLKRGIDPDSICFLLVLSSCSHTGLVKEGHKVFDYMVQQIGIQPKMEHYMTMVDLIGRAGFIDEAFQFIGRMPIEPDISIWGAFLGACRIHGDFKMGQLSLEQLANLDPRTAGYYKLIMSIYASKGGWDEIHKIRSLMKEKVVHKFSGCSAIEINGWEQ